MNTLKKYTISFLLHEKIVKNDVIFILIVTNMVERFKVTSFKLKRGINSTLMKLKPLLI